MISGRIGQIVFKNGFITKVKNHSYRKPATIGFIVAILASAFSALPDVIPKSLMTDGNMGMGTSPFLIVFFIYFVNAIVFTPLSKSKTKSNISKKVLLIIILLGIIECSGTLTYTIGLKDTSAVNATILSNSETIFGILIGLMVFRERLVKSELIPFGLIFLGET